MERNRLITYGLLTFIVFIFSTLMEVNAQSTFQKTIGGEEMDAALASEKLSNGNYLLGGITENFGNGGKDIILIEIDICGSTIGTKIFGGNLDDECRLIKTVADGGVMVVGVTNSYGFGGTDALLIKMDNNSNFLWAKTYGGSADELTYNLIETEDAYYLSGSTRSYGEGLTDFYLIKTNKSGNLKWTKIYGEYNHDSEHSLIESNNGNILLAGASYSYGDIYHIVLMNIDTSGALQWCNTYFGPALETAEDIIPANDFGYIIAGTTESFGAGYKDFFAMKVDENGLEVWSKTYGGSATDCANSIKSFGENGYLISGYTESFGFGDRDLYVINIDNQGELNWSKCYGDSEFDGAQHYGPRDIISVSDNGFLISDYTESFQSQNGDIFIIKADENGNIENCETYDPVTIVQDPTFSFSTETPQTNQANNEYEINSSFENIQLDEYLVCSITADLGNDTLLCSGDSLALIPENDYSSYLWSDGSTNNSMMIDTAGIYWVEVTNEYGCSDLDSITIELFPIANEDLELGPDTIFCPGEQLILNAGSGYTFYQWQDGSSDSIFIADTAGVYYVYVENPCSSGSDIIILDVHPQTTIDLGNDTSLCHNESLLLDAGFGYSSYLWQNGSNDQFLYATQSGLYWVEIMDNNECMVYDSITLEFVLPIVNIGNDTSMCEGDSITFQAEGGFIEYLWQDGSNQIYYTSDSEGFIWCQVTDSMGCTGVDTAFLNVMNLPQISIVGDSSFCSGDTISLLAYPWNDDYNISWRDGESDSSIIVSDEGEYWIKASNECGSNFDSVYISEIQLPFVFIGNDTIISLNTEIQLDAGPDFENYFWSNESEIQTITISEGGSYWVNVFDGQCYNSDTIHIEPIECDLFIPIVFTPNNDGFNDYFYAESSKDIINFDLTLFTRWGEVIWETTNKDDKWDGNYKGRKADDGTYFWVLHYKCLGSDQEFEKKGSLTLLR